MADRSDSMHDAPVAADASSSPSSPVATAPTISIQPQPAPPHELLRSPSGLSRQRQSVHSLAGSFEAGDAPGTAAFTAAGGVGRRQDNRRSVSNIMQQYQQQNQSGAPVTSRYPPAQTPTTVTPSAITPRGHSPGMSPQSRSSASQSPSLNNRVASPRYNTFAGAVSEASQQQTGTMQLQQTPSTRRALPQVPQRKPSATKDRPVTGQISVTEAAAALAQQVELKRAGSQSHPSASNRPPPYVAAVASMAQPQSKQRASVPSTPTSEAPHSTCDAEPLEEVDFLHGSIQQGGQTTGFVRLDQPPPMPRTPEVAASADGVLFDASHDMEAVIGLHGLARPVSKYDIMPTTVVFQGDDDKTVVETWDLPAGARASKTSMDFPSQPTAVYITAPDGIKQLASAPAGKKARGPNAFLGAFPGWGLFGASPASSADIERQSYTDKSKGKQRHRPGGLCGVLFRACACCCCFSPMICCLILIVLVASITTASFFIFPRAPLVDNFKVQRNSLQLQPSAIQGDYAVSMSLFSNNYIPWNTTIIAVILDPKADSKEVGIGQAADVALAPRTSANVTVPVKFDYQGAGGADPVIANFKNSCGSGGNGTAAGVPVKVKVTFSISGWSWLVRPTVEQDVRLDC